MRFRRVASDVWQMVPGGGRHPRRSEREHQRRAVGPQRSRDLVLTFISAWAHDDRATLDALSTTDLTCRWSGFGAEPETAQGLEEVIRHGRDFERRYGRGERYRLVESMGGQRHAAILFEPDGTHPEGGHAARIAVYRLEGERIAAIAVYGDLLD